MTSTPRTLRPSALMLVALALGSCKGAEEVCNPTDPLCGNGPDPTVSSIQVTSPVGTLMAVGRDAQFTAAATDASGDPVSVSFTWSSTEESTATVSGSGLVSAVAAGTTQIRAAAEGVTGSLSIQAVDADLDAIQALLDDGFFQSMVGGLEAGTNTTLTAVLSACSTNLDSGNVTAIQTCLTDALATSGADGTDTALLGVLSLYFEQANRLLGV